MSSDEREQRAAPLRIVAATVAFAVVHSVLASRAAKQRAERALGERARAGWYRAFYNAQAVATSAALLAYGRSLPDRTLWRARGATAMLLRAGQLAGLAWGAWAARTVGIGAMSGASSAMAWARGDGVVPREPEAQGPAPSSAPGDGGVQARGPFAWSRHPLNWAPVPVLWLDPHMTANLAAFNAVATLYLVAGSWHEETRLRAAYGAAYETFRRSGVAFWWPSFARHR